MTITINSPTKLDNGVYKAIVDGAYIYGFFACNSENRTIHRSGPNVYLSETMKREDNLKKVISQKLSECAWFRKPVEIIRHFMKSGFGMEDGLNAFEEEDNNIILKITSIVISSREIVCMARPIELSESIKENTIEELNDIRNQVAGAGGETIRLTRDIRRGGRGYGTDSGSGSSSGEDMDDEEYEENLREMIQSAKARAVMAKMEARRLEAEYDELYGDEESDESGDESGDEDDDEGNDEGDDASGGGEAGPSRHFVMETENQYGRIDDDIEELH